jgi:hypothetical protein
MRTSCLVSGVGNQKRPPKRAAVKEGIEHSAYPRAGGYRRAPSPGAAIYNRRYEKLQRSTAVLDFHMRSAHVYSNDARNCCPEGDTGVHVDALSFVAYHSTMTRNELDTPQTDPLAVGEH